MKATYVLSVLLAIPQLSAEALPLNSYRETSVIVAKAPRSEGEIFKSLNLSPAQLSRMRSIRQKYRAKLSQYQQSLKQAHVKLKNLMVADASASQIRAQHNRLQSLQDSLEDVRLESLLEMREVLNPTQRRKLAEMMAQKGVFRPLR